MLTLLHKLRCQHHKRLHAEWFPLLLRTADVCICHQLPKTATGHHSQCAYQHGAHGPSVKCEAMQRAEVQLAWLSSVTQIIQITQQATRLVLTAMCQ